VQSRSSAGRTRKHNGAQSDDGARQPKAAFRHRQQAAIAELKAKVSMHAQNDRWLPTRQIGGWGGSGGRLNSHRLHRILGMHIRRHQQAAGQDSLGCRYDAHTQGALRRPLRGNAAISRWRAERRTSRGGQPWHSPLAILTALTLRTQDSVPARVAVDGRLDRFDPSPARPRPSSTRSYHLVPPGGWPGRAAPAIRGRCGCRASYCRQHWAEVSRLRRMADGETRPSDTPLLAQTAHRP
jgi:hypothetical protein